MFVRSSRVSVFVPVLANNALRAHHASVQGGVSTNGLSDIWLIWSIALLEIMFEGISQQTHNVPLTLAQCYILVTDFYFAFTDIPPS